MRIGLISDTHIPEARHELWSQAYEAFIQLRGEAKERQVDGAEIFLTHNLSGLGEHHILIYGNH